MIKQFIKKHKKGIFTISKLMLTYLITYVLLTTLINLVIMLFSVLKLTIGGEANNSIDFSISLFLIPDKLNIIILLVISLFVSAILYWRISQYSKDNLKDLKGSAMWGTEAELKKRADTVLVNEDKLTKAKKSGFPIAQFDKRIYLDTATVNSLIVGSTRSGKSQYLVLKALTVMIKSKDKQHIIVNDPKGEIMESLYGELKHNGYNVKCLNLRDTNLSSRYDPLRVIADLYVEMKKNGSDDMSKINNKISTLTMLFTENTISDPIWPAASDSLFQSIILLLLEIAYKQNCLDKLNVYSLYSFFSEFAGYEEVWQKGGNNVVVNALTEIFEGLPEGSPIKNAYTTAKLAKGDMISSVLATLASNIDIFGRDTGIQKLTSADDFNFKDLLSEEKPTAYFMIVPDDNPSRHSIASLFIHQLYEYLVDYTQSDDCPEHKLKKRVSFWLDEFGNMTKIPIMDNKVTVCLGRNIVFNLAVQDLNQLTIRYGDRATTIRNNCNNLVYVYSNDPDTNKFFSELCGIETREYKSYSGDVGALMLDHRQENYDQRNLINYDELSILKYGDIVVKPQRSKPYKTEFTPFFKLKDIILKTNVYDIPTGNYEIKLSDILFDFKILWGIFYNRRLSVDKNISGYEDIESELKKHDILNKFKDNNNDNELNIFDDSCFEEDNNIVVENNDLDDAFYILNKINDNDFSKAYDNKEYVQCSVLINSAYKKNQKINKQTYDLLSNHLKEMINKEKNKEESKEQQSAANNKKGKGNNE